MSEAVANPPVFRAAQQAGLVSVVLFGAILLLVFHHTTWSMVSTWLRSETFAHGFLILPIALWLIWNDRDRLRQLSPRPAPLVALLMIFPGFVWLLSTLVDVLVIQQLAMVSLLVIGVWAILGHLLALAIAFPLFFLFFAVPMGEALVAPMMEFTATTTVWLIQQTGVPVYREGLYFSLPSGNWSVVEACSGVRYIIASITLGVLYAYLTYRKVWSRILFVLVSAIVPIVANTVRAYIIVMLGHWSDMTIATGVDHLIYGWVFFGLVMFLLFWIGSWFADGHDGPAVERVVRHGQTQVAEFTYSKLLSTTVFSVVFAAVWPWLAHSMESRAGSSQHSAIVLPAAGEVWRETTELPWTWRPVNAAKGQVSAFYLWEGQTLAVFIQYVGGDDGGEVVGSSTSFTPYKSNIRVLRDAKVGVKIGGEAVVVDEAQLVEQQTQLLAWSWYRVGNRYTSNDYRAKLLEAMSSLRLAQPGSYRIVVAMPMQESVDSTRALLQEFLAAYSDRLEVALNRTTAEAR